MRFRNTILALLVLSALGGFIYYYEYQGEQTRDAEADAESNALSFEQDKVHDLEIEKPGAGPLHLNRATAGWMVEAPIRTRADDEKISTLLSGLGLLHVASKLEDVSEEMLAEYGLKQPAVHVKLMFNNESPEQILDLGDKTPIGNQYYARKPGGSDVLVVSGDVAQLLSADVASLRYKRLIGVDSWKVARFQVEKGDERVEFVRGAGSEEWRLEKPISFPADGSKVQGLWVELQSAEATGFVSETATPSDLKRLGLDKPALTVTVQPMGESAGTTEPPKPEGAGQPIRVAFSAPGADGTVHVRRDDMPAVMTIGKDFFEKIAQVITDMTSYRDQRAAPVDRWKLSMIETKGGTGPVTLYKNEEDSAWHRDSPQGAALPPEQANAFIDAIEAIKANGYVEDAPSLHEVSGLLAALSVTLHEGAGETARTVTMTLHAPTADQKGASTLRRVTSTASHSIYLVPGAAVQTLLDQTSALAQPPVPTDDATAPGAQSGETKQP